VPAVSDRPDRRLDQLPTALIVERALDGTGDERAPPPRPHTAIELTDDLVAQDYVHTHVLI
jgi:hypothetical protein